MKVSPGPWKFDAKSLEITDLNGIVICTLEQGKDADGKLMAASALYHAILQRLLLHASEPNIYTLDEILEQVQACVDLSKSQYHS